MLPNNFDYHPHLSNNYYLDGKHQYNRQCVPTQQDGSSTGRHSVLDVKLFTHPGPYVALEESCRLVDLSIGARIELAPPRGDSPWYASSHSDIQCHSKEPLLTAVLNYERYA
ncbi:hypothetical protein HN011_011898 [Eciton burchellii]|nr:hypothetical protein HN011_011898 [Eciton burchellii]